MNPPGASSYTPRVLKYGSNEPIDLTGHPNNNSQDDTQVSLRLATHLLSIFLNTNLILAIMDISTYILLQHFIILFALVQFLTQLCHNGLKINLRVRSKPTLVKSA